MAAESPTPSTATQLPLGLYSSRPQEGLTELVACVEEVVGMPCDYLFLQEDTSAFDRPLLVIDCETYTPNRIQTWLSEQGDEQPLPPVALFNTQSGSLHESLLEWPCVRGLFFDDTPPQQLAEGLKLILEGELWVPRRLMQAYLERYRRPPTNSIKTPNLLTKREREILILLEKGTTNAAMANAMDVSEHTVKTHLYNIYKKINAANRIEAINWSRQNLTALKASS